MGRAAHGTKKKRKREGVTSKKPEKMFWGLQREETAANDNYSSIGTAASATKSNAGFGVNNVSVSSASKK